MDFVEAKVYSEKKIFSTAILEVYTIEMNHKFILCYVILLGLSLMLHAKVFIHVCLGS